MNENLGFKIRELRLKKGLTLKEISEKTKLSISFLSQLEHNKTSATLESFRKISDALNVSPAYFFSESNGKVQSSIVKGTVSDSDLLKTNKFIYKDLKGSMENPLFFPILVILNPGDNRGSNITHKGQEYLFVLEGSLTVLIDKEKYKLDSNDSIFLDATNPHYWQNNTDSPVKFLCISATG